MQDLADLDRPPILSEAAIADVPRTTLSGLEVQNPGLHRDIIIGLQATRDRDPRDPESPLISEPEADEQQEVLLKHRPCQGLPRVEDGNQGHHVVDLIMLHWLDVMFHTSLVLLELTHSQ